MSKIEHAEGWLHGFDNAGTTAFVGIRDHEGVIRDYEMPAEHFVRLGLTEGDSFWVEVTVDGSIVDGRIVTNLPDVISQIGRICEPCGRVRAPELLQKMVVEASDWLKIPHRLTEQGQRSLGDYVLVLRHQWPIEAATYCECQMSRMLRELLTVQPAPEFVERLTNASDPWIDGPVEPRDG